MNHDAAIREIDEIIQYIAKIINEHWAPGVIPVIEGDIHSLIANIYRTNDESGYKRWIDEFEALQLQVAAAKADAKCSYYANLLKAIKRDIMQKKSLAIQQGEDVGTLKEQLTQQQSTSKFQIYLAILVMVSSWIWMVPPLFNFSNLNWQSASQVVFVVLWLAIYHKFSIKDIKKEAVIGAVVSLCITLLGAYLSHVFGWV